MWAILRSIFAVLLGTMLGTVIVLAVEPVGHAIFPHPLGLDLKDPTFMAKLPLGAIVFLLVGWNLGALVGAWLAATLARRAPAVHGLIVGGFFLMSAIATMLTIPHPLWFWIVALLLFPAAAGFGVALAPVRKGQAPSPQKATQTRAANQDVPCR